MRFARIVVRLPVADREALDRLGARYLGETLRRLSRAAVVRRLINCGLANLDGGRPIAEQLPLPAPANERPQATRRAPAREGASLRERVLSQVTANAEEVFTPARVSTLVGASRDSVRNTLLVLAEKGRIEKLGPGQYRARRESPAVGEAAPCGALGGGA
ncbi:MAG: hypothetical protein QM820_29725 [Minicystis sp.]